MDDPERPGAPLWFPEPTTADEDGLVAIGGDLSVDRLLLAYSMGIFPWTVDPITWWSPNPRGIIEFDAFHVSRSLKRTLQREVFEVTRDQAFEEVIRGCATTRPNGNWISPAFIRAYTALHEAGHAHSVECWQGGHLAGGIYGVSVKGLFAGESMFYRANDASKAALYHLVQHLRGRGFRLLDVQMVTPTTARLGAISIPREKYLVRLRAALAHEAVF